MAYICLAQKSLRRWLLTIDACASAAAEEFDSERPDA